MNVVFAFLLILFVASVFHKLPVGKSDVYVAEVIADGHVAKTMPDKIKKDDKILSVNGINVDSAHKFVFFVQNSKLFDNKATKETINQRLDEFLSLNPSIDKNKIIPQGTKITLPYKKPEEQLTVSENVASGFEKYKNEEIELSEDEIRMRDEFFNRRTYVLTRDSSALEIATALADYYKPINIVLERDGKVFEVNNVKTGRDGTLGIKLKTEEIYTQINSVSDLFVKSVQYMGYSTKLMLFGLWQLVSGKIPASEMHGVVAIAKIGSDIISEYGMFKGLLLVSIISIDLALINILPIPALDGGHLMFIAINSIARRPLIDEKTIEKISGFFFALLILLMILVVFNDIWALITKKF